MLEPCDTFAGNLSARSIHNSNCFIKCAFRLKKGAAVRELLLRKVWKVPFFRPKQPCGRCCTTAVRSHLRFHPYKLDRIAQASCLLCARRENMLCFCIYWNRTKRKWRNCMFFGRPKTAMWAMLRCSHFVNVSIQALQTSSNVNSIMLNERKKREHALLLYFLKASKKKVAKCFTGEKRIWAAVVVYMVVYALEQCCSSSGGVRGDVCAGAV